MSGLTTSPAAADEDVGGGDGDVARDLPVEPSPVSARRVTRGVWANVGGSAGFALLVAAYVWRVDMSAFEVVRLCIGAAILWGPFALAIYAFAGRQVGERTVRATIAVAASYALTPALYFILSLAGMSAGLYVVQVAAVVAVGRQWWRRSESGGRIARTWPRPNWLALGLVGLALFTSAPYTRVAEVTTTGGRNLWIPSDSLYYVSQAYEIARELPVEQDPTRAGTPPRAYHLLPHVSTVLLARSTGQADLLRAQIVYHLTVMTALVSALLYGLGKVLSGRRLGGYALVALLYPLALVGPPWLGGTTFYRQSFDQFYFTPFPQLSSMLDPVVMGSWQTYSAVVVALGLMLVAAVVSERLVHRLPVGRLLICAGLLTASLSRFRAQMFMVAVPALLVLALMAWRRNRRPLLLASGLAPLLLVVPLVAELGSSRYRPGSAGMELGFNRLTVPGQVFGRTSSDLIFTGWPFSRAVHGAIEDVMGGSAAAWTWQVVCLVAFVMLNMLGPLFVAGAVAYLLRRSSWSTFGPFTAVVLTMAVGSVLVGIFLRSDFDSYSLAGQALYLPPWYLFPCLAVAVVAVYSRLQRRLGLSRAVWVGTGMVLVLGGALFREVGPESQLTRSLYRAHIEVGNDLSRGRWETFQWLRQNTPQDAVVISSEYLGYSIFFSGLGGRATYLEALLDLNDIEARRIYGDDRLAVTIDLWRTSDPAHFCTVLRSTRATHLVEFAARPLSVQAPPCLALDYSGPDRDARVWRAAA